MLTATKLTLGLGAAATAGLVAVTQVPDPGPREVVVAKSDRLVVGESWSPECEALLKKGESCVFQTSYGEQGKWNYVVIERREAPGTSTLVRVPTFESASFEKLTYTR